MPTYTPIPVNFPIKQGGCDLVDVSWRPEKFIALFSNSGMEDPKAHAIRVTFKEKIILSRIVDEFVYSVEDHGKDIGFISGCFAYKVTDSPFLRTLEGAANTVYKNPPQYSFFGQNTCLDVIASNPPQFDLIDLRPWLQEAAQNGNRNAIKWLADHPG